MQRAACTGRGTAVLLAAGTALAVGALLAVTLWLQRALLAGWWFARYPCTDTGCRAETSRCAADRDACARQGIRTTVVSTPECAAARAQLQATQAEIARLRILLEGGSAQCNFALWETQEALGRAEADLGSCQPTRDAAAADADRCQADHTALEERLRTGSERLDACQADLRTAAAGLPGCEEDPGAEACRAALLQAAEGLEACQTQLEGARRGLVVCEADGLADRLATCETSQVPLQTEELRGCEARVADLQGHAQRCEEDVAAEVTATADCQVRLRDCLTLPKEHSLRLWLDASLPASLFQDDDGTAEATADKQAVRRWRDRSGWGNDLVASGGTTPGGIVCRLGVNGLNGRTVVYFGGGALDLTGDERPLRGATAATLLVVVTGTAGVVPASGHPFASRDAAAPGSHLRLVDPSWNGGRPAAVETLGLAAATAATAAVGAGPALYVVRASPDPGTRVFINDLATPVVAGPFSAAGFGDRHGVGRPDAPLTAVGVAELRLYNFELTENTLPAFSDEVAALRSKWNLPVS